MFLLWRKDEEREGTKRERAFERSICYNKDLSLRLNAAEEKAPFERERVRERESKRKI